MIDVAVSSTFANIIEPVLHEMVDGLWREALISSFDEQGNALEAIEEAFGLLTSKKQDPEDLKRFFQSWSQTNNSATCVAGLDYRVTLPARGLPNDATQHSYEPWTVYNESQMKTSTLEVKFFTRTICGDDSILWHIPTMLWSIRRFGR